MDRFIVGTGRCGSTLLSRILAECPSALSVFEFFNGLDVARRFAGQEIPGDEFAELISAEQPFLTAVQRRGYEVSEVIYPFGEASRWQLGEGLPWILVGVLPRLSDDPDSLYDEVMDFARARPDALPVEHHRALFEWLAAKFGCSSWIERAGSSIDYLASLIENFPDARFVHIHRDGPEAALSMRAHHAYRLPISVLYDVPVDSGRRVSELDPLDLFGPATETDTVTQILSSRPPPEYFGRYWSDQLLRGFAALPNLDADSYTDVRFEDLVRDPETALTRIARFFELENDGWIDRAAGLVRGTPPTRFEKLPPEQQEALSEACRPGRTLLGREA